MLKFIKIISLLIVICFTVSTMEAGYVLEHGSKELVKKYNISQKNLSKEISRKEFVEILHTLYSTYKKDRGVHIDYSKYKELDNSKIFTDVKLDGDFGKKLSYFASIGAFAKNEKFNMYGTVSQKDYFTIMRRLKIMYSLEQCKNLKICEKELDNKFGFSKGTYLKYWSKILDKKLRKYYNSADKYIEAGYKPLLSPHYYFPLKGQTLNGCYPFSVRNITKYKNKIGMRIPDMEKYMEKSGDTLWNYGLMNRFDRLAHIKRKNFSNIDTIINSLQFGEPLGVTYYLEYFSYKEQKMKKVLHIVSAYSFDSVGIWVSETVSAKRVRVPWDKVFNVHGNTRNNRIFRYEYQPKSTWSQKELDLEKKYDFLVGEY